VIKRPSRATSRLGKRFSTQVIEAIHFQAIHFQAIHSQAIRFEAIRLEAIEDLPLDYARVDL